MLHPLLHLLATQPQLLGQHAQAYGELLGTEVGLQAHRLGKRALLIALAICFMGVSAVLGGTACLLWAMAAAHLTTPPAVMFAVPTVPGVLALVCLWAARPDKSPEKQAFAELRRQAQADMVLVREMGTP